MNISGYFLRIHDAIIPKFISGPDTENNIYTLWLFNIAMENGPFIDGLSIKNGDFPWLCLITRWYIYNPIYIALMPNRRISSPCDSQRRSVTHSPHQAAVLRNFE